MTYVFTRCFKTAVLGGVGQKGASGSPMGLAPCKPVHSPGPGARKLISRHRSFPQQTSRQVCRSHSWNTAMGTPPPPKGAFSLHLIPLQGDSAPLLSLQFTLTPPPLGKPSVQLPSGASCWGLSDTGADLVNRKLSAKQGRWSWRLRAPWARWAAHGVSGPRSGVSTHFPLGFNFQSNAIPGEGLGVGEARCPNNSGDPPACRGLYWGEVSMALASAGSRRVQWEVRSVGAGVVENRQCFFL